MYVWIIGFLLSLFDFSVINTS
uniref:Uncharacterized protein n=1 Tax=Rhizophora mucronata TaxID=61149 RepID=A0A2P2NPY7_RHIMU